MSSASRPEFCAAWYDVSSRGWCRWSLGLQCLPADGRALRPADRNAWRQCVEAHAALERCLHPSARSRLGTGAEDAEGAAGCSNSFALSCGGGQRVGAFSPRHRKPCICAEFRPPGRADAFLAGTMNRGKVDMAEGSNATVRWKSRVCLRDRLRVGPLGHERAKENARLALADIFSRLLEKLR